MNVIKFLAILPFSLCGSLMCAQLSIDVISDRRPSNPRITIITSVYDCDQFIEGFIQDIVQQTVFKECELLLINANSPGKEEAIINKYLSQFPNITYVKLSQDPGLYAVWNIGIELARSEYITNANADDRLAFNCYDLHAQSLDAHPNIDLVYSDFLCTSSPHETMFRNSAKQRSNFAEFQPGKMANCLPNNHPMWRKNMHLKYGNFDEKYVSAGDWEFWCRAVEQGAQFKKVQGLLALLYNNPCGLSTNSKRAQLIESERLKIRMRYGYFFMNREPMLVPLRT